MGLNARGILGLVGEFGERLIAEFVHGDIVADDPEHYPFADIVNSKRALAVQVKMSNGRHSPRTLPQQVQGLRDEIRTPFLFTHGVYAFVFYGAVHESGPLKGRSMIWSRKHSKVDRRMTIAKELQSVYFLDVRILSWLIGHAPELIKDHAIVFSPEEKPRRDKVLYLNRTFFARLCENTKAAQLILNRSIGKARWTRRTLEVSSTFEAAKGNLLQQIPIHVIGGKKTVSAVIQALDKAPTIDLNFGLRAIPSLQGIN